MFYSFYDEHFIETEYYRLYAIYHRRHLGVDRSVYKYWTYLIDFNEFKNAEESW